MDWRHFPGRPRAGRSVGRSAVATRRAATVGAAVLVLAVLSAVTAGQIRSSHEPEWVALPRWQPSTSTSDTSAATGHTMTLGERASGSLKASGGPRPVRATVPPTVSPSTWVAWAMLDRSTGKMTGSANLSQTNNTESMIKAWIAADDLRRHTERGETPTAETLTLLSTMIRDSSNSAAETVYRRNGRNAVVQRLISMCGLTDTRIHAYWWSLTQMSPRDAVRMGQCIANGRAAGPQWTQWLLTEMRNVRGSGRFGIISALAAADAARLAIKNGWTAHGDTGKWNVNCLAIADGWILAVETRYPFRAGGLSYGAGLCADIARTVLANPA